MTKYSSNLVWENLWCLIETPQIFDKSVVFGSNTIDFVQIPHILNGSCIDHVVIWSEYCGLVTWTERKKKRKMAAAAGSETTYNHVKMYYSMKNNDEDDDGDDVGDDGDGNAE